MGRSSLFGAVLGHRNITVTLTRNVDNGRILLGSQSYLDTVGTVLQRLSLDVISNKRVLNTDYI